MVEEMVHKFKAACFETRIAGTMIYDSQTIFNENNISGYLGELEELITKLIISVAAIKEDPQAAAIAALNMSKLTEKRFDKAAAKISMPSEVDSRGVITVGVTEYDTTDEIDPNVYTNRIKLYQHYANAIVAAENHKDHAV
jgi:hypothetical protein